MGLKDTCSSITNNTDGGVVLRGCHRRNVSSVALRRSPDGMKVSSLYPSQPASPLGKDSVVFGLKVFKKVGTTSYLLSEPT